MMEPMTLINDLAKDLNNLSKTLTAIVQQAQKTEETDKGSAKKKVSYTSTVQDELVKEEAVTVTIEQVRAVLAEKSQSGLTGQVKTLLEAFGAPKLSAVKPEHYAKLLAAAKELK